MTGVGAVLIALVLSVPAPAAAENGKVAFTRAACTRTPPECVSDIWAVDPNGTNLTRLTNVRSAEHPAWSLNGQRLAYVHDSLNAIYTIREDGNDRRHVLTWGAGVQQLSWSPDGSRLVASLRTCPQDGCRTSLYTMRTDGTELSKITPDTFDALSPAWSPDGSRIAFNSRQSGAANIWTVAPDGSDLTQITHRTSGSSTAPAWSRDGDTIAFGSDPEAQYQWSQLFTMRPDGSELQAITPMTPGDSPGSPTFSPDESQIAFAGEAIRRMPSTGGDAVQLTTNGFDSEPDWQFTARPGPIVGHYPRPKSASPMVVPLVPAFQACGTPNRRHGPPLAELSCAPPAQASQDLTIGTPDVNGRPTAGEAYVRFAVIPGNPATQADDADVSIQLRMLDVYDRSDLSDYGGEIDMRVELRITDRDNLPPPDGTDGGGTTGVQYLIPGACAPTADANSGATCRITTTFDAVSSGIVKEGKRAVWGLDQIQVWDGGADGDVSTFPNNLFQVQGVFVP